MFHLRNCIAAGFALIVLFATPAAFAQNDESAGAIKLRGGGGDPVAGKEKSFLCQGCHGADGISFEPLIPKLAGQYGKYIAKQIRNYQGGTRSHQIMNAMAATVDAADLADISAYFASQPKMKGEGMSSSPSGEYVFSHDDVNNTRPACTSCHGANGKGVSPATSMYPVLGGQHKEYIFRQLVNFRAGIRTNSPSGIMNIIAKSLTDAEIEALAEYVSAQ
jgi:cytochrome c553